MDPSLDAVLPAGVARVTEGAPPPRPPDFAEGYVLPAHSVKPLQTLHTHPLDATLVFYEEPHVYTYAGVPTTTSVTGMAHEFEDPFEPLKAIDLMKNSRSQAWPRLEYVEDAQEGAATWTPARGALLHAHGKTVAALPPHSLGEGAQAEGFDLGALLAGCAVRGAVVDATTATVHSFERVRTDVEIQEGWARKGMLASHEGTEGHYQCERFLNGLPVRHWEPEMAVLFDFVREHLLPRGIVAWNTEKEIVCADADVAGSIDAIFYEPSTGLHHIVDFKRSDKLRAQMRGYGKMRAPFQHLDDCKGAAYALQTSIYQYILEREYGMRIGARILLSIHPDQPFCTGVPYLRAEVDYLFRKRYALVAARKAVAVAQDGGAKEAYTCSLTGAPLVDAVRLEAADGGGLAMEKAALARGLAFTVAADVRASFEAAVAERLSPVALAKTDCVAWRRRVPETGLAPFE